MRDLQNFPADTGKAKPEIRNTNLWLYLFPATFAYRKIKCLLQSLNVQLEFLELLFPWSKNFDSLKSAARIEIQIR